MPSNLNTVYIVDDDAAVRDSLSLLLSLHGFRTALFSGGEAFLAAWSDDMRGCLLLDIRMPGIDGITLQKILIERHIDLPVIIITGHGAVDSAREAFKLHAVDFLEKPLQEAQLVNAINEALQRHSQASEKHSAGAAYARIYASLTPREREVLHHVIAGHHNKAIAEIFGISVRTVEVHKSRVMSKIGAKNSADLVRQHLQNEGHLDSRFP